YDIVHEDLCKFVSVAGFLPLLLLLGALLIFNPFQIGDDSNKLIVTYGVNNANSSESNSESKNISSDNA
ncbi:hypothetical protein ACJMK2_012034, partial [Sinanodonta woodiana]